MIEGEAETLSDLMFRAEQFCSTAEMRSAKPSQERLRLKIGECRNLIAELQTAYNEDRLTLADSLVKAQFRFLIMALIWVMFEARDVIDHKRCAWLVSMESTFTFLLIGRTTEGKRTG